MSPTYYWCRNSRPESSGLPQLLTHQAHQDGQILHVTVSHHGRTYVGALVLESKWSVYLQKSKYTAKLRWNYLKELVWLCWPSHTSLLHAACAQLTVHYGAW